MVILLEIAVIAGAGAGLGLLIRYLGAEAIFRLSVLVIAFAAIQPVPMATIFRPSALPRNALMACLFLGTAMATRYLAGFLVRPRGQDGA